MKKILAILMALLLCISLSACQNKEKWVRKFVDYYASHLPEKYFETHNLDYKHLYDIKYEDASIKKRDGGKSYYFVTYALSDDTHGSLTLFTDKRGVVTGVQVYLSKEAMALFKNVDELRIYYSDIIQYTIAEIPDAYLVHMFAKLADEDYVSVETLDKWSLSLERKEGAFILNINQK